MPMRKKILCILLTAILILSLIPSFALPTRAASNMKTSEKCIEILKQMEGFVKYPMYDHGQYSVGYGSGCDPDDYPNGITEEEADALLREYLVDMEKALNSFADRQHILFSQNQFDALLLFTYNCGPNWMGGDGEFRQAVVDGTMGNNFIFCITQWSSASSQLHMGLVNRRLIEADMYINGSYENVCPSNYTYVLYDNNEGVGQTKVQGYDSSRKAYVKAQPTREDQVFLGWYTAAEGGAWVTELTADNGKQTLYAHWQNKDALTAGGTPAKYDVPSAQLVSREFYDAPGGKSLGSLNEQAVASVVADYVDAAGVKWGCLANGCWVKLGDPRIGTGDETEELVGVEVNVTGDYVNVRTGPGTDYQAIAAVLEGDVVFITETRVVGDMLWGRFRAGWICLEYTDYTGGLTPGVPGENEPAPDGEKPIAIGTVISNGLNIRAAAGTKGYLMGCYSMGDKVEIFEKTTVGGAQWGRTVKGWICLTYVKLEEPSREPEETTAPETTAPETTVPETTVPESEPTVPEETQPETTAPAPEQKPAPVQGIPGTVISKTGLNIRSGAGTNYRVTGTYASGTRISILEQKTVGGINWGRTELGWVSMQYVQLEEKWTNENGVYGVVISTTALNIRSAAGVAHSRVGYYSPGDRIVVYEQSVVSGQKWGRTDKGWVCMDYVRLDQSVTVPEVEATQPTNPTPPETTVPEEKPEQTVSVTGMVTAGGLNIRNTPGTGGKIVGSYKRGDRIVILEQKLVNGARWGRTDKGWISLNYVKLDQAAANPSAGFTGTITATNLCIRKGPGTGSAVVGSYVYGQKVTILETSKVGATLWGRTELGWICMDYVK